MLYLDPIRGVKLFVVLPIIKKKLVALYLYPIRGFVVFTIRPICMRLSVSFEFLLFILIVYSLIGTNIEEMPV